ncbi:tautomerase family protein [Lysobacter sp. P5_B9]
MPLIQCHLSTPLSTEQKRSLVTDLVEATVNTLNADPKTITVILHEHQAPNIRELDFVSRAPG